MKSAQLLSLYAQGERNFANADLRGCNLKGKILSHADFSGADIRGANFTGATLESVNFSRVKAGLQKRGVILQLIPSLLFGFLAGFLQWFPAVLTAFFLREFSGVNKIAFLFSIIICLSIFDALFDPESESRINRIFSGLILLFAVAGVGGADAVTVIFAGAGAVVGTVVGAGAGAVAGAVAGAGAGAGTIGIAVAGAGAGAVAIAGTFTGAVAGAFTFTVAVLSFVLGIHAARQGLHADPRFSVIRTFGLAFGSLGGTCFAKANLTGANFSQATLKNTNFRAATLTWVDWKEAKQLDYARVGETILSNLNVQKLLVSGQGYKQSYENVNLEGANLEGANLEGANLEGADLSQAILHQAILKNANLTESACIGTDFSSANLTGACLQNWNIDSDTSLTGVDCQYIYLSESHNNGYRQRLPRNPNKVFQPGEFEKLYK